MGNWWSTSPPPPKVRYEVVLPTGSRSWELLYSGDVGTWDAVAGRYGMDKFAYCCELSNCDRESVCLRYVKATLHSDKQAITIDRYKASSLHIPVSTCRDMKPLLANGFRLNEVAAAQRGPLVLLVLHKARDYISQVAFVVVHLGSDDDPWPAAGSRKKDSEKPRLLRRLNSKRDLSEGKKRLSGSSFDQAGGCNGKVERHACEDKKARCLGVLHAPHKDMTIISCHVSPDLSRTAIMFYSLSKITCTFCYTLHFYSNHSLQHDTDSPSTPAASPSPTADSAVAGASATVLESPTPHLLQTVKLSREVQPYFVFDPRYSSSRIAVANYECRDTGIAHELVVLNLDGPARDGEKDVQVVKRGKLSLPALFGNSRFNLLYSKDGELIILQKLTDDRFGVTSFCDIYIFHADDLTLIKYMTASLPGLFHICKVSYEPVFSRCGSYMRILDHRASGHSRMQEQQQGEDAEDCPVVQVYQLPRSLRLLSQCRRVILQQLAHSRCVETLPLPQRLKDYLRFGPIY